MKKLFAILATCLLMGCVVEERVYADGPQSYQTGTVLFCDDYGCREVTAPYYYDSSGAVVYYDAYFGYWIGPHGYWRAGVYYPGFWVGYHAYYHAGFYHWRSPQHYYHGGGYHGGYHGGGGHHR